MSAITYNGGTPGGDIVAKSVAGLLHNGDTLQIAAGLCDESRGYRGEPLTRGPFGEGR